MMLPREHGAYGQLLFPLVTALAIGRPSVAAVSIAIAASALFVAHEPMLVVLGRRGAAVRRARSREAAVWLIGCGAVAIACGVMTVAWLPASARWTLAVPMAAAAVAAACVARGRERTTAGEMVVAAALASVSLPIAVAASASTTAALTCALAYTAVFIAGTVSVRAVIQEAGVARARASHMSRGACRAFALGTAAVALGGIAILAARNIILPAGVVAALPMSAVALSLVLLLPPARYLRRIGWTLVATTALTGIILVAAIR